MFWKNFLNLIEIYFQQLGKFLQPICQVADANRAMVGSALAVPALQKIACSYRKTKATVGVSDLENLPRLAYTFRNQQPEPGVFVFNDGEQCNGTITDGHFNRKPLSHLAVIDL